MIAIKRILVPVDFSDFSRHAVDHALALARWSGASITALYVVTPVVTLLPSDAALYPPIVFTPEDLEQFRQEVAGFVRDEGRATQVDAVIAEGNVTPEILRAAEELPADLIAMGTHGRSGFDRLMLGSVTERVLRRAPCPVLTVPPRAPDAMPLGPVVYRRILCAIDFSPTSMKALEYASALAQGTDATLTVVTVVETLATYEPVALGGPGGAEYERVARGAAESRLRHVVSDVARQGVRTAEIVTTGKPYREILRLAAEHNSELIVIGVHGGGWGLLAFGSTTNHIVREATCPVLTVRA